MNVEGETSPHHSDAFCIAQFHIHPGFFLKSCTCLFSGMKFQPVRDKYTLPPTNISYPKRGTVEEIHPFLLGYLYFSDANYVCSMVSTSFKGWYVEEVRRNIENTMLAAYFKWKKGQVSDFWFFCLGWIRYLFQFLVRNNLPHTPSPSNTYDRIFFRDALPNCHQILKKRIMQGLLFLPRGSVKNECISPGRITFLYRYPAIFRFNHGRNRVPSLKPTCSTLNINGWKKMMIHFLLGQTA